jgi:hypothetical protein
MRKLAKEAILCLFLSSTTIANAQLSHLEKLRASYPYGLIGNDYGLLTEEDLAVNTCNTLELTPFSAKNMAYPYWQCFSLKDAKMECDSMGYDSVVKKETGYMEINASNENGVQSYLARDARDMRECKSYLQKWKEKTHGEQYVCLSGSSGAFSGIRDGRKETDWVLDKFKTRKGCVSTGGECSLKAISKDQVRYCHRPTRAG